MGFQATKKSQIQALTEEVTANVEMALSELARECDRSGGLLVCGLTISPSTQGEGWICVLRLHRDNDGDIPAEYGRIDPGDYVAMSHGASLLESLCELEAKLRLGEARFTEDKYAAERAAKASTRGAKVGTRKGNTHR